MDKLNKDYYNAPVELYRRFLEHPKQCLADVLDYQIAKTDNFDVKATEQALSIDFGDKKKAVANAKAIAKKTNGCEYSGVLFGIPRTLFWDYYEHDKTTWEQLVLLAYLSLKSWYGHKDKPMRMDNEKLFTRMTGNGNSIGFHFDNKDGELGAIAKHLTAYKARNLRESLSEHFRDFHYYSCKGKRGWAFMFADGDKYQRTFELAQYMEQRTKKYRRELQRKLMEAARAKALQEDTTPQQAAPQPPATQPRQPRQEKPTPQKPKECNFYEQFKNVFEDPSKAKQWVKIIQEKTGKTLNRNEIIAFHESMAQDLADATTWVGYMDRLIDAIRKRTPAQ